MSDVVDSRSNKTETPYSDDLPPHLPDHDLSQAFQQVPHASMEKRFADLPTPKRPHWAADRVALIAGPVLEVHENHLCVKNKKSGRKKQILRKDLVSVAEVGIAYREKSTGYWYLVTRRSFLDVSLRLVLADGTLQYLCL